MNLISKLSDNDLLIKVKSLVEKERRITQEVIDHLEEVEYRKLYLARGYDSLLQYCISELKYSETSAKRRASAMWLIRKIPQAKEKLESGSVNLSTLTQLNSFLRREEKVKTYTPEMKLELLEKIEGKSQDQCEREFIKISPLEISYKEKQKPLTEEFTQITFVASNRLKAKLDKLKNLTAHKSSSQSTAELIEILADMALKKLDPAKIESPESKVEETQDSGSATVAHCSEKFSNDSRSCSDSGSRYIPVSIRQFIWKRDQGCCQYIDKETNKKCESKFALQIDHIHPFSLGGSNKKENLRLLCRAHNNWRTKELFAH